MWGAVESGRESRRRPHGGAVEAGGWGVHWSGSSDRSVGAVVMAQIGEV